MTIDMIAGLTIVGLTIDMIVERKAKSTCGETIEKMGYPRPSLRSELKFRYLLTDPVSSGRAVTSLKLKRFLKTTMIVGRAVGSDGFSR